MTEQNVPALRFPEFEQDWVSKRLDEVAAFSKGKGISKSDIDPNGATPCIRYGELYTDYDVVVDEPVSRTSVAPANLVLSDGGEVIVPASGEDAKDIATAAVVLRAGVALGGDLNIIKSKMDGAFLAYYLSGKKRLALAAMAQGNSVVHLYPAQLGNLHVSLPSGAEQEKIAAFLGVVDEKINGLEKKKALLTDYKRGVMQKLFSQELRFKDDQGHDFPDWEEKRLGEVFTWVRTNSLSREKLGDEPSEVQNIHYGDIHTKFHANFRQEREHVPYILGAKVKDFAETDFCQVGDVVIADASEDYADIGKAIEIVELGDVPLVAGLHTYIARPKNGSVVVGFAGYLLRSGEMRKQIMRIAQGISVLGVSKGNLEKLTLELPHREEQRKIADFLAAIDSQITHAADEIAEAKTFKKGLLQQMFV